MASFSIPTIDDNEEGWGPNTIPDKFQDVPYYAPFSKGDKLGKASDWQQQYQGKGKFQKESAGVNTIFNWYYQDDDNTFQLVDNTKTQTKRAFGRRFQNRNYQQMRQQHQRGQNWQQQPQRAQNKAQSKKQNLNKNWNLKGGRWGEQNQAALSRMRRETSVEVKPDWQQIETLEFNQLAKVAVSDEPQPEDLKTCGTLEFYDKSYERITTQSEKSLERTDRAFFNVTTSDDPIIRQLTTSISSPENGLTVFATDVILSHLMVCTRSVYPWDIIITKVGSKIFLDKRDGQFNFLTVNETAAEPPVDDGRDGNNSPSSLGREATFINQNFSQQVLVKEPTEEGLSPMKFGEPNPFQTEGEKVASVAYRYRRWNLGDGITLVARTQLDAVSRSKGKDALLSVKALNEYDPKTGVDWRKMIDSQRGAVLATELKNNSNKLATWTAQALLAGVDNIKLGYVSRVNPKDNYNHVILATMDYKPREFATTINLNIKNTWGILRNVIQLLSKQENGKYVLLRDHEKPTLKLFRIPDGLELSGESSKGRTSDNNNATTSQSQQNQ